MKTSSGSYQSVSTYWNGADPTIISQSYCYVSLSVLTASPYSLVQGATIIAQVQPVNVIGTGTSNENTSGALIVVVPLKPTSAPSRVNSSSTKTAIGLSYSALTGTNTGGSAILSYELQWDQGTGTWASLVGYNPYSTATTFVTPSTLTTGNQYQFKYRAVNALGWGPFSDSVTLTAAGPPDQMAKITTTLSGASVVASWTYGNNGGSTVTGFTLMFLESDGSTYAAYIVKVKLKFLFKH